MARILSVVLFIIILIDPFIVFADEIIKKDGEVLEGIIEKIEHNKYYRIRMNDGKLIQIGWYNVKEVIIDKRTPQYKKESLYFDLSTGLCIGLTNLETELLGIKASQTLTARLGFKGEFAMGYDFMNIVIGGILYGPGSYEDDSGNNTIVSIIPIYTNLRFRIPVNSEFYVFLGCGVNYSFWSIEGNSYNYEDIGKVGYQVFGGVELKIEDSNTYFFMEIGYISIHGVVKIEEIEVNRSSYGINPKLGFRFLL